MKNEIEADVSDTKLPTIVADLTWSSAVFNVFAILKKQGVTADILENNSGNISQVYNHW